MLDPCVAGEQSVFRLCEQRIDIESIYDNTSFTNKTRFSQLPTKLPKGNMPVTFNKKIKSSGYGGAPDTMKYSAAQKQRKEQIARDWLHVSTDMLRPLALSIPPECASLA